MPTEYYRKSKVRLRKEACERYHNLSEKEKQKQKMKIWFRAIK